MHALYRNHMGNDLEVVNDAKISFAASSTAESWDSVEIPNPDQGYGNHLVSIPKLKPADERLIQFLARGCRSGQWEDLIKSALDEWISHSQADALLKYVKKMPTHWTPFGHQVIKLKMQAPVPIRTQCFKHKIGLVENEESRRYISSTPELFIPEFRSAPEGDIKQGSGGIHPDNELWKSHYEQQCNRAIAMYEGMIAAGIAPEQARFVLPQGVLVNWVWTGSLYAFAEFYNKRSDRGHAQSEIADLADQINPIMEVLFPVSWKALTQ